MPLDAVVGAALLHLDQDRQINLEVPDDLPMVRADAGLLERVVVNLLANAQTASPPDQPVEVSAEIAADQVSLIIADPDQGAGGSVIGSSSPFSDYTIAPLQGWGSALPSLGLHGSDGRTDPAHRHSWWWPHHDHFPAYR